MEPIIEDLVSRHSDNLIAIYGIGSYFDPGLSSDFIKNDIDLILIVKSIDEIPREDWNDRYKTRNIGGQNGKKKL